MTYIDSLVREAHSNVEGQPLHEQLLAEFSQVYRSANAQNIFSAISGISIDSKDELVAFFKRVKKGDYNLQAVLREPDLEQYIQRTSQFQLD